MINFSRNWRLYISEADYENALEGKTVKIQRKKQKEDDIELLVRCDVDPYVDSLLEEIKVLKKFKSEIYNLCKSSGKEMNGLK